MPCEQARTNSAASTLPAARRYNAGMTVAEIKKAIEQLEETQLAELREWLWELDADEWDRQMKRDAEAGKLDAIFDAADAAYRAGKTLEAPGAGEEDDEARKAS